MRDGADMGLLTRLQGHQVKVCPVCIKLREEIEALIGTEEAPRDAPDSVLMPLLTRWQQHKDDEHPSWSAYLRRTT